MPDSLDKFHQKERILQECEKNISKVLKLFNKVKNLLWCAFECNLQRTAMNISIDQKLLYIKNSWAFYCLSIKWDWNNGLASRTIKSLYRAQILFLLHFMLLPFEFPA